MSTGQWVRIFDTCPMDHRVDSGDHVEFVFGCGSATFEIAFARRSLREFVMLAAEALAEMDALNGHACFHSAALCGQRSSTVT